MCKRSFSYSSFRNSSTAASVLIVCRLSSSRLVCNALSILLTTSFNCESEAFVDYEIDEYDERFLRHLALGYTKEQITNLRGMPFGVKSLEKRQNELVQKLFPNGNGKVGVNDTRLVVRAIELRIIDIDNIHPDDE